MADSGVSITSTQSLRLDLPPSCIEFCPAHPSYFVVGTYNLQKEEPLPSGEEGTPKDEEDEDRADNQDAVRKPQSRNGSLVVFEAIDRQVSHVHTVTQPSAILDLHFQPQPNKQDVCGVVSSTGTLTIVRLSPGLGNLEPLKTINCLRLPDVEEDVLFTAFAWHPTVPGLLAVTTSTGIVYLAQLSDVYDTLQADESITITHSLEAWCVAFSPPIRSLDVGVGEGSTPFTLYSGGDDSTLRYLTCASENHTPGDYDTTLEAPYSAVSVSGHGAGVTAILPLPLTTSEGSHIVLTGSYDDVLRIFAIRPLHESYGARQARLLAELNLGGGVWRIKTIDLDSGAGFQELGDRLWRATLLISCMHAGARVVEVRGNAAGNYEMEVLGRFEEHKSMNYGSDFQQSENGVDRLLCVSTSFYDKLLCVWEFEPPK